MAHDLVEHSQHVANSMVPNQKRNIPLVPISLHLSRANHKAASAAHKLQYQMEWGGDHRGYFGHFHDPQWQRLADRQSFPGARDVYSSLTLQATRSGTPLLEVLERHFGISFNTHQSYFEVSISRPSFDCQIALTLEK